MSKKFRRFNWKKAGLGVLFAVFTVLVFYLGHFAVSFWDDYFNRASYTSAEGFDENWQVYKNDDFGFGLRYPADWEVKEVKSSLIVLKPIVAEGEQDIQEYVSLKISSTGKRGKTSCENDQASCSFYANEIFGDKTITPDEEIVFFSNSKNDFTLVLHKYGIIDLAGTFESIGQSLRFVSPTNEQGNAETT